MTKATSAHRRPKGTGTIRPVGPDRWRVFYRAGGADLNARVTGTRADAQGKLNELINAATTGAPGTNGNLGQFLDWWLDDQTNEVTSGTKDARTVENYRWAFAHLEPLRRVPLRHLEAEQVERRLAQLAKAGLARSSVSRVRSVLTMALDVALARRKITLNAARLARMPATAPPAPPRSLDEAQVRRLWDTSAAWPLQHAFLVTGWQLGLRPGELLGLAWPEVDLDAAVLTVNARLDRGGKAKGLGEIRRKAGAKAGSERRVVMPPETVAALKAWRRQQKAFQMEAGPAWSNPDNAVFTSEIGTLIYPSNMDRRLAIVTQAAGLEGRWSMTDLGRRTSASVLSANHMPLEEIADQFGHRNTRMLEKHYRAQLRPNDKHLAVWERFMSGAK
jgi:integrase